eukprot:1247197-Amphidinium_carterae.1
MLFKFYKDDYAIYENHFVRICNLFDVRSFLPSNNKKKNDNDNVVNDNNCSKKFVSRFASM